MSMQDYIATRDFRLSKPDIQIVKGTLVQFDGMNILLEGYPQSPAPNTRGAIRAGWLVPPDQYDAGRVDRPVSAGMQLRPADGGNPMQQKPRSAVVTAQEEERHVGNVAQHAQGVRDNNRTNYRQGQRVTVTSLAEIESQDGIPVRHLGSPDGRKNPVDMSRNASAAIAAANSVQVQPGEGRTREEIMAAMTPEQREAYAQQIQARKAEHGILDEKVAVPSRVIAGPDQQGTVVGRVRSARSVETEGIKATNTVGGGTDTVDLGGTGGQTEVTVVEREGIRFVETNGPKKDVKKAPRPSFEGEDPRRVIAMSFCPDFPENYDFDASVRRKIARIQADFEDRPDIIKAVAAAETDAEVKIKLIEEFPHAFQS